MNKTDTEPKRSGEPESSQWTRDTVARISGRGTSMPLNYDAIAGGHNEVVIRLMAQRDQLLAACKAIRDSRDAVWNGSPSNAAVEKCLAAIARAEGNEQ